MKRLLMIVAASAGLAACGQPDRIAEDAETGTLPDLNETRPSPTGSAPPPENIVQNALDPAPTPIPAALHGRWGLSPADCTSTRGDAKGLLVVTGDRLRFYESIAVPGPGVLTTDDTIGGNFNFTGEGQTWTKYQNLQVENGRLVRTERDPVASFRYVRCD